jgi:hypothetical protein
MYAGHICIREGLFFNPEHGFSMICKHLNTEFFRAKRAGNMKVK